MNRVGTGADPTGLAAQVCDAGPVVGNWLNTSAWNGAGC